MLVFFWFWGENCKIGADLGRRSSESGNQVINLNNVILSLSKYGHSVNPL